MRKQKAVSGVVSLLSFGRLKLLRVATSLQRSSEPNLAADRISVARQIWITSSSIVNGFQVAPGMLEHVKELLREQMCSGRGERSRVTCRVTGRGF
jgi:hypothetical protein